MKLFPHTLIRIGGSPFDQLDRLIPELKIADQIASGQAALRDTKNQLSDSLFQLINSLDDKKSQNALLNLRRDIHNDRSISEGKLEKVKSLISAEANDLIQKYRDTRADITKLTQEGEQMFNEQLQESREQFKDLINDASLQNGLILSSRDLLGRITAYQNKPVKSLSKNDLKAEQSLIKYITRICAKTSPYSTFTNLVIANHSENKDTISLNPNNGKGITSHVRLNNYLYKYLKDVLLKTPEAYQYFLLRPNPTIQQEGDNYLFLTNNNNLESFQRMEVDAVLELFTQLLSDKPEGLMFKELVNTLSEYIEAELEELQNYIHQLVEYGFMEFNLGVSGIDPDWDVVLCKKLQVLADNNVPHIKELIEVLKSLRKAAKDYETASLDERKEILSERFDEFKAICMTLHEAAGLPEDERKSREELQAEAKKRREEEKKKKEEEQKAAENEKEAEGEKEEEKKEEQEKEEAIFKHVSQTHFSFKPEQIFYEDTTLNTAPQIDDTAIQEFVNHLNDLLQQMQPFAGMQEVKEKMHDYFINKYEEGATIDLFTFYEDYYREYKKPEAEREEKLKKQQAEKAQKEKEAKEKGPENKEEKAQSDEEEKKEENLEPPMVLESIKARGELMKEWKKSIGELVKPSSEDATHYNVTLQDLKSVNEKLGAEVKDTSHNSYGTFIQLHKENDKIKGVLNSAFGGYGKMLSRFMHIFDQSVTDDMREWNMSLNTGGYFVENCDASYFNANLHPPLMPYEIWMPGGHNSLPEEKQIPVTDFAVKVSEGKNRLDLVHKESQKPANIFDLGFQGSKGRSELFQLLSSFTKSEFLFPFTVTSGINEKFNQLNRKEGEKADRPKISIQPRILYEDTIVLQRKGWNIPAKLLPIRNSTESNWEYFVRINQWRNDLGIPDEVFIFVNARSGSNAAPANNKVRAGRDDYKPQYINFKSPILVNLLEKALKKVPYSLKIEEMAPYSDQLLEMNNEKYVTEFMIQWYNYEQ